MIGPALALATLAWIILFGSGYVRDAWMVHRGNEIVVKIEAYRAAKGELPNHLGDIGITETETGPFYYNRHADYYDLYYGKSLGESMSYSSKTKTWNDEG